MINEEPNSQNTYTRDNLPSQKKFLYNMSITKKLNLRLKLTLTVQREALANVGNHFPSRSHETLSHVRYIAVVASSGSPDEF
jgi:hypothetical protein